MLDVMKTCKFEARRIQVKAKKCRNTSLISSGFSLRSPQRTKRTRSFPPRWQERERGVAPMGSCLAKGRRECLRRPGRTSNVVALKTTSCPEPRMIAATTPVKIRRYWMAPPAHADRSETVLRGGELVDRLTSRRGSSMLRWPILIARSRFRNSAPAIARWAAAHAERFRFT